MIIITENHHPIRSKTFYPHVFTNEYW